ncbi:MAG: hypothetical protein NWE88_02185 [Candidatus Bathyarchaeota archaeon]|nr:hypothetical protein [Candidatus Bathyarchaeota archaeon]
MHTSERMLKIFTAVRNAMRNEENYVIIENPGSEKIIQFAVDPSSRELVMDIPIHGLTQNEFDGLINELSGVARDTATNEAISFQESYSYERINDAVAQTEKIFREVYSLPPNFDVTIQVFS